MKWERVAGGGTAGCGPGGEAQVSVGTEHKCGDNARSAMASHQGTGRVDCTGNTCATCHAPHSSKAVVRDKQAAPPPHTASHCSTLVPTLPTPQV